MSSGSNANDLRDYGLYRWTSANAPTNAPETGAGNLLCLAPNNASAQIVQLVVMQTCHVYVRWRTTSTWYSWHRLGEAVKSDTIMTTTTWSGSGPYTQTVTLTTNTPTSNSKIDIQPDATTITALIADGVQALYISNNDGTLTAYAVGAAPTSALTLQVTITEVAQ